MTKDSMLKISDIEDKIAGYKNFFDSTKEVNEQVLLRDHLTDSQNHFLETLQKFDYFAKTNRNPARTPQISSQVVNYIDDLDKIEQEIKAEQERRLSSQSSTGLSDLFHHEMSVNAPLNPERKKFSTINSKNDSFYHQGVLEEENLAEIELRLKREDAEKRSAQIADQERYNHVKSNASALFAILKSLENQRKCPEFIAKQKANDDLKGYEGDYFEVKLTSVFGQDQEKIIRVVNLEDGDFAILCQSLDGVFRSISDRDFSDKIFGGILKAIYLSAND